MIGTREREAPMTTDWNHDMDAAPRDGRYLYGFDEVTAAIHRDREAGVCIIRWTEAEDDLPADWEVMPFGEGLDVIFSEIRITAWMPLPDPPKESEPTNPEPSHD